MKVFMIWCLVIGWEATVALCQDGPMVTLEEGAASRGGQGVETLRGLIDGIEGSPQELGMAALRLSREIPKILTYDVRINRASAAERLLQKVRVQALEVAERLRAQRQELKVTFEQEIADVQQRYGDSRAAERQQFKVIDAYLPKLRALKEAEDRYRAKAQHTDGHLSQVRQVIDELQRERRLPDGPETPWASSPGDAFVPSLSDLGEGGDESVVDEDAAAGQQSLSAAMQKIEELLK